MARRHRRNRRHRKGRFAFLYKVLAFLAICAAIVVAMALFFKANVVTVAGNERYTDEEVLAASGIRTGDNMFLLNKYEAAENIRGELPYVETVRISRQLPDKLNIVVTESTRTLAVEQNDQLWLFCINGKLVENVPADQKVKKCIRVTGLKLKEPKLGKMIASKNESACEQLLELLAQLNSKKMLDQVQIIHMEDPNVITFRYMKSFNVQIPWHADLDYKLNYLTAVIEKLEENEKGTIVLTQDGEARFVPE